MPKRRCGLFSTLTGSAIVYRGKVPMQFCGEWVATKVDYRSNLPSFEGKWETYWVITRMSNIGEKAKLASGFFEF